MARRQAIDKDLCHHLVGIAAGKAGQNKPGRRRGDHAHRGEASHRRKARHGALARDGERDKRGRCLDRGSHHGRHRGPGHRGGIREDRHIVQTRGHTEDPDGITFGQNRVAIHIVEVIIPHADEGRGAIEADQLGGVGHIKAAIVVGVSRDIALRNADRSLPDLGVALERLPEDVTNADKSG